MGVIGLASLPRSDTPTMPSKKQHLIDDLLRRMRSGEFPPGAKLPSGRELCAEYSVSRQVVNAAVDYLKYTNQVVAVPGSGIYVPDAQVS